MLSSHPKVLRRHIFAELCRLTVSTVSRLCSAICYHKTPTRNPKVSGTQTPTPMCWTCLIIKERARLTPSEGFGLYRETGDCQPQAKPPMHGQDATHPWAAQPSPHTRTTKAPARTTRYLGSKAPRARPESLTTSAHPSPGRTAQPPLRTTKAPARTTRYLGSQAHHAWPGRHPSLGHGSPAPTHTRPRRLRELPDILEVAPAHDQDSVRARLDEPPRS